MAKYKSNSWEIVMKKTILLFLLCVSVSPFASKTSYVDIGDIKSGILVGDEEVGTGHVMYSEEDVHTRFSSPRPYVSSSRHLIVVRHVDGKGWQYNDNVKWTDFNSRDTDVLVAFTDFYSGDIKCLDDFSEIEHGIHKGYAWSDFACLPNTYDGKPNLHEFTITGTKFIRSYFPQKGRSVDITWRAPSTREDGEALDITDIRGYEIRYAKLDNICPSDSIEIARRDPKFRVRRDAAKVVTIDGGWRTSHTINGLVGPARFQIEVWTVDTLDTKSSAGRQTFIIN